MRLKIKNLKEIKDGTNNSVYSGIYNQKKIIIKKFYNNKDSIQRNVNEYRFTKFLYQNNFKSVAKPIKILKKKNISIYQFLEGKKVKKIKGDYLKQCAKFINQIQLINKTNKKIPYARDKCICLDDHLNLVNKKIVEIEKVRNDIDLQNFIQIDFKPSWDFFKKKFKKKYFKILKKKLSKKNLIISPSDFNFNNIILNKKKLYFFDFEYSGLDDAKKLISDFICQPQIEINDTNKDIFINQINSKNIVYKNTIKDLIKLHQYKWCLILLNVYISNKIKKKQFYKIKYLNKTQLKKSIRYFNKNKLNKYGN